MISYMTPSRIEYVHKGTSYTVHGEALDPAFGGLDYVVYANDFHLTDESRRDELIDPRIKAEVLDAIKAELAGRGTRFEVEDEDGIYAAAAAASSALRCEAGQPCPREGHWFTPARADSRRRFSAGEVMPDVGGDYGTTIWQWDEQQ